jgi:hypothetical protein
MYSNFYNNKKFTSHREYTINQLTSCRNYGGNNIKNFNDKLNDKYYKLNPLENDNINLNDKLNPLENDNINLNQIYNKLKQQNNNLNDKYNKLNLQIEDDTKLNDKYNKLNLQKNDNTNLYHKNNITYAQK